MLHTKKVQIFFFIIATFVAGFFLYLGQQTPDAVPSMTEGALAEELDRVITADIEPGDTFSTIANESGIEGNTVEKILSSARDIYDLASIKAGKTISFTFDHKTTSLIKVIYEPNTEQRFSVTADAVGAWNAELTDIHYEIKTKTASGHIESSLYETGLGLGIDERAIIALAEMFAWQIDFAVDIRVNDAFTIVYEERYRDGAYVMPGRILAAKFSNAGDEYKGFGYADASGTDGYFDESGNSLQKIFLKSPLQYRYISSVFTNARYHPILKKYTAHHGIDYAASYGTPAVTVGDGTVVSAGWNGGYGNAVDVRHNETYTTRYGHFSKIAVRVGQKVSQGDVVGYVGSTGWSTGPHLHYEMIKFGSKVNPFDEEVPPSEPLDSALMPTFQEYIKQFTF